MGDAAACDGRKRDGRPDPAAVVPCEADLVAEIRDRISLKAIQGENLGIAAEHVGARKLPDPLGTGVEMRDATRAVDDDDAIIGAFSTASSTSGVSVTRHLRQTSVEKKRYFVRG